MHVRAIRSEAGQVVSGGNHAEDRPLSWVARGRKTLGQVVRKRTRKGKLRVQVESKACPAKIVDHSEDVVVPAHEAIPGPPGSLAKRHNVAGPTGDDDSPRATSFELAARQEAPNILLAVASLVVEGKPIDAQHEAIIRVDGVGVSPPPPYRQAWRSPSGSGEAFVIYN